jgi:NTP pyrophosphatase (non-canonical NTP hydrolase)
MEIHDYIQNCLRTESPADKVLERVKNLSQGEIKLFKHKLDEVIKVLNDLDKWKKYLFYGKVLPKELGVEGKVFTRDYEEPIKLSEKEVKVLHSSMGCATESGELLEAIRKVIVDGNELDTPNLIEEQGDLLWYNSILSDAIGVSFDKSMDVNIAKLKARYPEKFTEDKAINRDLVVERKILEDEKLVETIWECGSLTHTYGNSVKQMDKAADQCLNDTNKKDGK